MPIYDVIIDYTASSVWTIEAEDEDAAIAEGIRMERDLSEEELHERLEQTFSQTHTWASEIPVSEVTNA